MAYAGELIGVGLPKALCVAAIKVHSGVAYWEFSMSGPPTIEGLLYSSSYRCSLMCTLIPPSRGWRERG